MTEHYLFAFSNFMLAAALCVVVVCRLNNLPRNSPFRTQCIYALCMLAGVVSASQPWVGEWPRWASISSTGALLLYMMFSRPAPLDCCR